MRLPTRRLPDVARRLVDGGISPAVGTVPKTRESGEKVGAMRNVDGQTQNAESVDESHT